MSAAPARGRGERGLRRWGLAVASALALAAVPGTAAAVPGTEDGWSVDPAGPFTATAPTQFTDSNGGQFQCAGTTVGGTFSSDPLVRLTSVSFPLCTGAFAGTLQVTATMPWTLGAQAHDPDGGTHGTGVTTGSAGPVLIRARYTGLLGACSFSLSGTSDFAYNNPGPSGQDGTLVLGAAGAAQQLVTSGRTGPGCGPIGPAFTLRGTFGVLVAGESPVVGVE
ncbi:hypothetical protein [Streptomyces nitrosporeus]|uniref:hypothetical protein n=1 Tax=Streptomyces nitrosporeus TaxID=28894 RepID=UPI00399F9355